jgi:hypothetical protein
MLYQEKSGNPALDPAEKSVSPFFPASTRIFPGRRRGSDRGVAWRHDQRKSAIDFDPPLTCAIQHFLTRSNASAPSSCLSFSLFFSPLLFYQKRRNFFS